MADQERELFSVEQRDVDFYGDNLIAIRGNDSHVYVAVGQMCDALGIDRASQVRRIRNDEILANGYQGSVNLTYPDGGTQRSGVLRVDLIPLWLTGLRIKAVSEDARPKLRRFKQEAAKVLWEAFQDGRLTADPTFSDLLEQDTPEVQAYKMLQGMLQLARNQILIRSQLEEHENRLEAIESQLASPEHTLTQTQAMQISQAVKAVAIELGKQTKRNEFGGVYGEMYRKFEVTSYKALPAAKFEECLAWLTEWHVSLTNENPF